MGKNSTSFCQKLKSRKKSLCTLVTDVFDAIQSNAGLQKSLWKNFEKASVVFTLQKTSDNITIRLDYHQYLDSS